MITVYGQNDFVHELNGVKFHHLQSKNIKHFYTPLRLKEIKAVVPKLETSEFPTLFPFDK